MEKLSRRKLLKVAGTSAGITVLGMPAFSSTHTTSRLNEHEKKKILVIGAHPDDAETGCGGTITLLSRSGHELVSVYLTRGEAGIKGKSYDEAALIRTREAIESCKIMGARPIFLTQIDGSSEITAERYEEMFTLIQQEKPDVVLTHWPIDGHRDHRICSILVYDAWIRSNHHFDLYYFEVESGQQSQHFFPTDFVNIESVIEDKHSLCHCHASQGMDEVFGLFHTTMEKFRGIQGGCKFAEAFVKHHQVKNKLLS